MVEGLAIDWAELVYSTGPGCTQSYLSTDSAVDPIRVAAALWSQANLVKLTTRPTSVKLTTRPTYVKLTAKLTSVELKARPSSVELKARASSGELKLWQSYADRLELCKAEGQ